MTKTQQALIDMPERIYVMDCKTDLIINDERAAMFGMWNNVDARTGRTTEYTRSDLIPRTAAYDDTVELIFVLGQIIDHLPTNKDWLDPDIERAAKAILAKYSKPREETNETR